MLTRLKRLVKRLISAPPVQFQSTPSAASRERRELDAFHEDLDTILNPLYEHRYSYTPTALDIFFAYRLFLMRAPEDLNTESLTRRAAADTTIAQIKEDFLNSPELRLNLYGECRRPEGRIVLVPDGDLRFAVDPQDRIIGWAIINGCYESETRHLIESLTRPGMTCLDIGANVGFVTALLGRGVGPSGRVISYEPFPAIYQFLERTVADSGLSERVELRRRAASDTTGTSRLAFASSAPGHGGSYVLGSGDEVPSDRPLDVITIESVRLDDDLQGVAKIDLVKMDIEGFELRALRGMEKRLQGDQPIILMEINPACLTRTGTTPSDILQFLFDLRYTVFDAEKLGSGQTGDDTRIDSVSHDFTSDVQNVLAIPADQTDSVLARLAKKTRAL